MGPIRSTHLAHSCMHGAAPLPPARAAAAAHAMAAPPSSTRDIKVHIASGARHRTRTIVAVAFVATVLVGAAVAVGIWQALSASARQPIHAAQDERMVPPARPPVAPPSAPPTQPPANSSSLPAVLIASPPALPPDPPPLPPPALPPPACPPPQLGAALDNSTALVAAARSRSQILLIGQSSSVPSYWSAIPSSPSSYVTTVGTALTVRYSAAHDVWLLPSRAAWSACDFSAALMLSSASHGGGGSGPGARLREPDVHEPVMCLLSLVC